MPSLDCFQLTEEAVMNNDNRPQPLVHLTNRILAA